MDISFVVITNGKKVKKTDLVLNSTHYQKIENYEIIVCGEIKTSRNDFILVKKKQAARNGFLGEMRNNACEQAKYDNIVILDDDMILSLDWYENLKKHGGDFDILTSQVRLPDGTRFWDHCCYQSPRNGHVVLEHDEDDDHLYMSGGQAWIMKSKVFKKNKWNSEYSTGLEKANMKNLKEYKEGKHNEDTDFSLKCRSSGFKIKHNHDMIAFHDDPKYTCVGRIVRIRQKNRTHEWVKEVDRYLPAEQYAHIGMDMARGGFLAESADVIRYGLKYHFHNIHLLSAFAQLEKHSGGKLSDERWSENGDPHYLEALKIYEEYEREVQK